MVTDDEIYSFFENARPDSTPVLKRAVEVFDLYGLNTWLDVIGHTFNNSEHADENQLMDLMLDDLRFMLNHLLIVQGITPNEDAHPPLDEYVQFVKDIRGIVDYDPKETMLRLLESDESAETKLLHAVEMVGPIRMSKSCEWIADVDDGIPAALISVMTDTPVVETIPERIQEIASKMFSFVQKFDLTQHPFGRYLTSPNAIGLGFLDYVRQETPMGLFHKDLSVKEGLEVLAKELVYLAILSGEVAGPLALIQTHIAPIVTDVKIATALITEVSRLVRELGVMGANNASE